MFCTPGLGLRETEILFVSTATNIVARIVACVVRPEAEMLIG